MQNERREKKPRFFALKEGVEASSLNRDQKKKNNLQSYVTSLYNYYQLVAWCMVYLTWQGSMYRFEIDAT